MKAIIDQLRELIHQHPFQPFTIHLAGGKSLRVAHQDFLFITVNNRVIFEEPEGPARFLNPTLISEIEMPAGSSS